MRWKVDLCTYSAVIGKRLIHIINIRQTINSASYNKELYNRLHATRNTSRLRCSVTGSIKFSELWSTHHLVLKNAQLDTRWFREGFILSLSSYPLSLRMPFVYTQKSIRIAKIGHILYVILFFFSCLYKNIIYFKIISTSLSFISTNWWVKYLFSSADHLFRSCSFSSIVFCCPYSGVNNSYLDENLFLIMVFINFQHRNVLNGKLHSIRIIRLLI